MLGLLKNFIVLFSVLPIISTPLSAVEYFDFRCHIELANQHIKIQNQYAATAEQAIRRIMTRNRIDRIDPLDIVKIHECIRSFETFSDYQAHLIDSQTPQ